MAPSHYLNQCLNIINWTLRNKLQWILNRNSNIFFQENALENVVSEMASIFSQPQCVNCSQPVGVKSCHTKVLNIQSGQILLWLTFMLACFLCQWHLLQGQIIIIWHNLQGQKNNNWYGRCAKTNWHLTWVSLYHLTIIKINILFCGLCVS